MSDKGTTKDHGAPAKSGQRDEKTNAEIEQQARIDAELQTMLGRPLDRRDGLHSSNALLRFMGDNPPDLQKTEAPPSYAKLKEMIGRLEDVAQNAKAAHISILAMSKTFRDEAETLDREARNIGDNEFDEISLIRVIGVCSSAIFSNLQLYLLANARADELRRLQSRYYPPGPGRKRKNVRAYLVAEKLAAFYLTARREMPTFGTGDGGIPSTDFARALEVIFEILGIEEKIRGPAEAAIAVINEAKK